MVDPRDDPIELSPSRHERWREAFAAERDRLSAALRSADLADDVRIEHVGSTAVPDIAARDVVDVVVVVDDDAVARVSRTVVEELGGTRFENSRRWHPVFREHAGQRFDDHVFAASDDGWKVSVVTREVLRADPTLRAEYERLKRRLATESDSLDEYTEGKTPFVKRVLDAGRADDALSFDFAVPSFR